MKSRSHNRLPTSDPIPDDWVDGSWTVDCVCGVNFDDGEEMVNCDVCGVWVHTRCSRYVKSEKSFACDKCKMSKNNTRSSDSKETEVAQLLVELPTTTLRMDNPHPPPTSVNPRRRSRLWTDIPIQERVHVQGIPGGEPTLFGAGSLSSVFTPQLWKSTGYVPKKFNFQYREFPCWDEEKEEVTTAKTEEENENPENENPVDKGAGVLFSLSKNNVITAAPVATSIGIRIPEDNGGFHRVTSPLKDVKKWEGDSIDVSCPQNGVKKDRTLLRPFVVHSGKRKKEDSGTFKDRSGKKKVRVVDRDGDSKKRVPLASKTALTLSSDARQLESCEDRDPKIVKTHSKTIKNADLRGATVKDPLPGDSVVENNTAKPYDNLSSREKPSEALVSDVSGHNFSLGARLTEQKTGHQISARSDSSCRTVDDRESLLEQNDPGTAPVKEEVGLCLDNANENGGGSPVSPGFDPHKSDPLVQDAPTAVAEGEDGQNPQRPSVDKCPSCLAPEAEVKSEADLDSSAGTFNIDSSTVSDVKPDVAKHSTQHSGAPTNISANLKTSDTAVTSSQFSDQKVQNGDKTKETANNCEPDMADKFASNPCQPDQPLEEVEVPIGAGKSSSELKHDSRSAEEPSKVSSTISIPQAPYSQRKLAAPSSVSSAIMISKRAVLDSCKTPNAQNHNPIIKRGISDSIKKDNGSTHVGRGEERNGMPRKSWKDGSKTSVSSVPKVSHSNKLSHASDSKKTLSDSKDSLHYASSKASSTENVGVTSLSGEPSSSLQSQSTSHVQNKVSASGIPQRGEKVNQSNSQPSTKVPVHPPGPSNSTALLSDEELALLLHQELNSSPRVPRVPRMRHTGSLPQLGSPTATSMLVKRTSSSGGRDHNVFARRKAKDLPKHESSSRDIDDEAKMDRLPPSRDPRRHDSVSAADAVTKRETDSGSGKGVHAVKKSAPTVSTATVSSGPSSSNEANEQNFSSMCNSPRNNSDDDTGTIRSPTHRTLPGLIAEIMSKGKRMTYEELCSAVLPHWPNLRKHNGERYAYSSHLQAVLDCLRNRHEWAQLVDRGPKTNAGRKKRKLDAEAPSFESDDNEYGKDTTGRDVESKSFESHREEFPKGKRKARKRRRRLALRGRSIKEVRKQRKADALSYDDADSFSSSSEVSVFSDDEIQGGGSEASASSDERGTAS